MRRFDSLLLAGVGVLIVHQIAYTTSAVFGIENSVTHGHLAVAWFAGSLALLAVLARAVTHSLKSRHHESHTAPAIAAMISFGYIAMEQVERLADGYGAFELFAEPVFWLGMAIAPLVALVLHWSVQTAAELVSTFLATPSTAWFEVEPQPIAIPVVVSPIAAQLSTVVSRRGPPVQ